MVFPDVFVLAMCLLCRSLPADALDVSEIIAALKEITENGLGTQLFQKHLMQRGRIKEEFVDWEQTADNLAASLSKKLVARGELIEKVVSKFEEAFDTFTASTSAKQCCKLVLSESHYSPVHRKKIDLSSSCYDKYRASSSTVKHPGQVIFDLWKKNYEESPTIHVQYFGSVDGFSYIYPSYNTGDGCGGYDSRVRPWYSAAMAFRKLMIIVVDMSTEMRNCKVDGETCVDMIVSMLTVLLDTLTTTDHMALVTFHKSYHFPEEINGDDCYGEHVAIGSRTNKDALLQHIKDTHIPQNAPSVYSAGIHGALHYLRHADIAKQKAIIVFLTGTSFTEGSFDPLTQSIQKVKEIIPNLILMAYFVGKASSDDFYVLRKMSNTAGRGGFTQLARKDDINQKVGDFYKALASSIPKDAPPVVTQPYFDSDGQGLVTTVCKAVLVNGELYGVAAQDVSIADLFADAVQFSKSRSHVVVIDTSGRTLAHPLLPKPTEISGNFVDIEINALEPVKEVREKVFDKMKQHLNGNAMIYAPLVKPRGTSQEGIFIEYANLTYNYRKVHNTAFSLCVVAEVGDTVTSQTIARPVQGDLLAFTYHDALLQNKDTRFCKQFYQALVKASVVKLASKAFLDPFAYESFEETADDVKHLEDIVRGYRANDKLLERIVDEVHLTHYLDEVWRGSDIVMTSGQGSAYYGWRYINTLAGVLRLYPGLKIAKDFDASTRHWFKRTAHSNAKISISRPYLDTFGAGYVVSANQLILKGITEKPFGVMGIDLPVHYFYHQMLLSNPECNTADHSCFITDSSGILVVHPDWFNGKWKLTEPVYYENIHMVKLEWDIAADMFQKKYMTKRQCVNLYQGKEIHFTLIVVDSADHMDSQPYYEYQKIPDTNIYLFRKDVKKSLVSKADEKCTCREVCEEARDDQCQCPCYSKVPLLNTCTGQLLSNEYSCTEDEAPPSVSAANTDALLDLKPCFKQNCGDEKSESECHSFVSCRWCDRDSAGRSLEPYCGQFDDCFFGQVGHRSPYDIDTVTGGSSHVCAPHMMMFSTLLILRYI